MEETPSSIGPEFGESGDPEWIEPALAEGGAFSETDQYIPFGRWRERLYKDQSHPADLNPVVVGRIGLRRTVATVFDALRTDQQSRTRGPATDTIVRAMIATYEALEWIHSLDEHLRATETYKHPTDLDAIYGAYVEGAVGARNASHHGLRRVLGVVPVAPPIYAAHGKRWVHTGTYHESEPADSVRWLRTLPRRTEIKHAKDQEPIYSGRQLRAFEKHLAGREVRLSLRAALGFFEFTAQGTQVPSGFTAPPSWGMPPIDPSSLPGATPCE